MKLIVSRSRWFREGLDDQSVAPLRDGWNSTATMGSLKDEDEDEDQDEGEKEKKGRDSSRQCASQKTNHPAADPIFFKRLLSFIEARQSHDYKA